LAPKKDKFSQKLQTFPQLFSPRKLKNIPKNDHFFPKNKIVLLWLDFVFFGNKIEGIFFVYFGNDFEF